MDGCGYFRYFLYITLPLSTPILSTVAVIAFVSSWNNYLLPLLFLPLAWESRWIGAGGNFPLGQSLILLARKPA